MSERTFDLELELLTIDMSELNLNEKEHEIDCEVHSSGKGQLDADPSSRDQPRSLSDFFVPEFWEFSYKSHPNSNGDQFPILIEVIIFKNGNFLSSKWFDIGSTNNIQKCGISAITKCCSDLMVDFRARDKINFYLSRTTINS